MILNTYQIRNLLDTGVVENGDRIAQGVFAKIVNAEFHSVDSLEKTERGDGGFGHTDVK